MLCDTKKKQMEMKLQHAHMLTNTHKLSFFISMALKEEEKEKDNQVH